jgi:hypothetical protein
MRELLLEAIDRIQQERVDLLFSEEINLDHDPSKAANFLIAIAHLEIATNHLHLALED